MGDTEPFDGYSDASVAEIEKRIADAPEGPQRETLKETIRTAEYAREDDPRAGVLKATEPAPPPPPPEGALEDEPEDTSGRPDLAEVAEGRAGNRNVRVLDASEEE